MACSEERHSLSWRPVEKEEGGGGGYVVRGELEGGCCEGGLRGWVS